MLFRQAIIALAVLRGRVAVAVVRLPERTIAVSVIIPCLNEAGFVESLLQSLQAIRSPDCELIVVDGGSTDGSTNNLSALVDKFLVSPPGRARQMNCGAQSATGAVLWFLHADSMIDADLLLQVVSRMQSADIKWGRLRVSLSSHIWKFRVIEKFMEWRSRLTGMVTGDQGMFVTRDLFFSNGGFADIPLMEDIALSKKLRRYGWPEVLDVPLLTSSRRWEERGILRTVLLMWRLRLAYFFGVSPHYLAKQYR